MLDQLIAMVVVGAVVGALARLFLRGDQRISILWTIVLGAVGAVLGAWLAGLIGVAVTISLGLIRWIFSVVAAMILINIYITATRR
ncbi:GlsB/YeaQ/YmgE family stress response membrane protein [Actinomyces dentalis]|jgi:membrane protein|uniref:GlsB/YeaQ/YmgE family stress response membrane protein n=1 Tax=Actinomyces dentalis TaxID=272548 RepID=UPI00235472FB|nr:GlsB/YeaQ/YmgE family stress response membrane protein [Actinomyces dentalis]